MDMRRLFAGLVVTMMAIPFAPSARAQTKTLQGDMQTITATVEAVQASTRTLTLKGPNGNYVDMVVPETVTKFSNIKVGDKICTVLRQHRPAGAAAGRQADRQ